MQSTLFWLFSSLGFSIVIFYLYDNQWVGNGELSGEEAAFQYLSGYLLEKSLSLDNIFAIGLIFSLYKIPYKQQSRILTWGIVGVLLIRFPMILLGIALFSSFWWMNYVFGVLLLYTAMNLLITRKDTLKPRRNFLIRWGEKKGWITHKLDEDHFFSSKEGHRVATPLFLTLLLVAWSDLLFAIDSIPAILAFTTEPLIIFSSNLFAILGLRSLYFILARWYRRLHAIKISLVLLLLFVAAKMSIRHYYTLPTELSLLIIFLLIAGGIIGAIFGKGSEQPILPTPIADELTVIKTKAISQLSQILIIALGITVTLIGIAMLVLPGPAILVIPLGLAILSQEIPFIRKHFKTLKGMIKEKLKKK